MEHSGQREKSWVFIKKYRKLMILLGTTVWLRAGVFFEMNETHWWCRDKKKWSKISLGDKEQGINGEMDQEEWHSWNNSFGSKPSLCLKLSTESHLPSKLKVLVFFSVQRRARLKFNLQTSYDGVIKVHTVTVITSGRTRRSVSWPCNKVISSNPCS